MSQPHLRGPTGRWAALVLLLGLGVPSVALADVLDDLRGRWGTAAGGSAVMEWSTSDGGFALAWTPRDGAPTTVWFAPAGRPKVYTGSAKGGWSMMGAMFGDDDPVNPLSGGTLYWARSADDAVYVYSLAIDDRGGFVLDRYAAHPAQDALAITMTRRTAKGSEPPQEQKLVRLGP